MPYAKRWFDKDPLYPYKDRGEGYYYQRGLGYFAKINVKVGKNLNKFLRSK